MEKPQNKNASPALLHLAALAAMPTGAIGVAGMMLLAGRHAPPLLSVIMAIWVIAPFMGLAWSNIVFSKHWPAFARMALECITVLATLATLVIYGAVILQADGAPRATAFVMIPVVTWILIAGLMVAARFGARGR